MELVRNVYYNVQPGQVQPEIAPAAVNLGVIGIVFAVCLVAGTALFVRAERNR